MASGFTLIELLIVLAIIGVLIALSIPALSGLVGAPNFNGSLGRIAGILEQARAYATGQNTYVWVAFYPVTPSTVNASGGEMLFVAVFASSDGTNPISSQLGVTGTTPASYAVPATVSGTPISQVSKPSSFKQLHMAVITTSYFSQAQIPSLPTVATTPSAPTSLPQFQYVLNPEGITLGAQTAPSTMAPAVSMVEFTPSGSAQVAQSLVEEIEIDLQPMKGTVVDTNNLAALRINGLTGLTTIYRN